jgi:ketosteroid isomerase-like protein
VSWQVSKLEVSRSGDLAYAMSVYQFAQKDPQGKPVTDHGKDCGGVEKAGGRQMEDSG